MSFFAILFALLIEQARPLARTNPIHAGLRAWALSVSRNFDAGKPHHGWVAWSLAVLVPALVTLAVHWLLLLGLGWPFAVVWSVAVLYVTLGFRQFSHHFTGIRDALELAGFRAPQLERKLTPAWTTDWITDSGRERLRAYGIAPPDGSTSKRSLLGESPVIVCPQCGSAHTEVLSEFGSTACKALYRCVDCREPFDYFKCI